MNCICRACLAFVVGYCIAVPHSAAQNLVVNGDFETGEIVPWEWFGTGVNTATISTDTPSGSGLSVDLDINNPVGLPWLIQDVPITGGEEYTFSATVREVRQFQPEFDAWIAAQIYMLSSPESGAILNSGAAFFTNPNWETQGYVIAAPPTATIARILFTPQAPDFSVGTGQYRVDNVSLVSNSADIPGDFDGDGDVDDDDLADWKAGFGTGTTLEEGDADADGDVDGGDFVIWQQNVTPDPIVPAAAAVPEPAGIGMFVVAVAALARYGRRR